MQQSGKKPKVTKRGNIKNDVINILNENKKIDLTIRPDTSVAYSSLFTGSSNEPQFYYDIRNKFGLSAQLTIRVIGKVVDTYLTDRSFNSENRTGYVLSSLSASRELA